MHVSLVWPRDTLFAPKKNILPVLIIFQFTVLILQFLALPPCPGNCKEFEENCQSKDNVGVCTPCGEGPELEICYKQCYTDKECLEEESCRDGSCRHVCSNQEACGLNAVCKPGGSHYADCSCPEGTYGKPHVQCRNITDLPDG